MWRVRLQRRSSRSQVMIPSWRWFQVTAILPVRRKHDRNPNAACRAIKLDIVTHAQNVVKDRTELRLTQAATVDEVQSESLTTCARSWPNWWPIVFLMWPEDFTDPEATFQKPRNYVWRMGAQNWRNTEMRRQDRIKAAGSHCYAWPRKPKSKYLRKWCRLALCWMRSKPEKFRWRMR